VTAAVVMAVGLLVLSLVSGMLGLGVAFAAVPFLSFFLPDLVNQVQPLSLILNGLTALAATVGFARSGYVDWRRGGLLAVVTTVCAPAGAVLTHYVPSTAIWVIYLLSVAFLAYRLFRPVVERPGHEAFGMVLALAAPISVLSGLLGVGPGFLLMPALIVAGFPTKRAAGMNALAVTPPSFSALLPHLATARFDLGLTLTLVIVGSLGGFLGARLTSRFVPGDRLKQIFGVLIVVATLYKVATLKLVSPAVPGALLLVGALVVAFVAWRRRSGHAEKVAAESLQLDPAGSQSDTLGTSAAGPATEQLT
jgi:uncharacterized membrane protein YfcA